MLGRSTFLGDQTIQALASPNLSQLQPCPKLFEATKTYTQNIRVKTNLQHFLKLKSKPKQLLYPYTPIPSANGFAVGFGYLNTSNSTWGIVKINDTSPT